MNDLTRTSEFRLKLYPKNFDTVREFYEKTLGFSVDYEWDRSDSKGVMFNTGAGIIEMIWWPADGNNYTKDNGVDISLAVKDVKKLWNELKDKPFIEHELRHNPWGDTSFGVYDPEGFNITFFTED